MKKYSSSARDVARAMTIPPFRVAEAMLARLARDEDEITVGQSESLRNLNRQEAEKMFLHMNGGD